MTLLLCVANQEATVYLSDRRLTADGHVVDEDATKALVLLTRDARLVVGFTGLASVGRPPCFRTHQWIAGVLAEVAAPDYAAIPIVERFAARATSKFSKLPIASNFKGLGVMFAGYRYRHEGLATRCEFVHYLVHNFEGGGPGTTFKVFDNTIKAGRQAYVAGYGSIDTIPDVSANSLLKMAE